MLAALAAPAAADDPPPEYEAAFKAGTALFEQGEYAAAREQFQAAYDLQPKPLLLLNIGSTYRRENDAPRALEYYRRFLSEAEPDDPYRDDVAAIVSELEAQVAEQEREGGEQTEREPPPPAPEAIAEPTPTPAEPATGDRGRGLRLAGLITAGAGVLALGVGLQQGLHARSIDDELEGKMTGTEWTPAIQERYDEGQAAETRAIVLSVVGGVALATGATLYLRGRDRAEQRPSITVAPYTDGTATGLAVGGRF